MNTATENPSRPEEKPKANPLECNICYEDSNDPVTTICGHIYCWSCIYKWLEHKKEQAVCPVCNNVINKEKIIPLYTKGGPTPEERKKKAEQDIPKRPQPEREERKESENDNHNHFGANFGNFRANGIFNNLFTGINFGGRNFNVNVGFSFLPILITLFLNIFLNGFSSIFYYDSADEYVNYNNHNTNYNNYGNNRQQHSNTGRSSSNSHNSRAYSNTNNAAYNTTPQSYELIYFLIVVLFFALPYFVRILKRRRN